MKEYSYNDLEEGLDCYDPAKRVFPRIETSVSSGEELNKRDVLLILRWKLDRLKDKNSETVADANVEKINEAVRDARKTDRKIDVLKALTNLPGIGLATATAILTACYPKEFTIIDWRVLGILELFPSSMPGAKQEGKDYSTNDWTAESYIGEYLPRVKKCAERWGRTLRDTDRVLWGLSVSQRIEELIESSKETPSAAPATSAGAFPPHKG
jgi:hypothetical protein